MQTVLKREEIDFIFELYRHEPSDDANYNDIETDSQKRDSAQTSDVFKPSYLT
ncbi:hypothetical protein NQT69_13485 [Pseudoalteromonas shioyasakiensis]|uniref:hypothetical protein n=1 Tax=Pseudoalteromonas shioyasakiensis TaxID=1190813 RepID=UPI002117CB23|nr:hypothetical protein [Pseudoalteromonas shioyasakiensis]MCQ8879019.1 hypothetical protein [Pseudoalteromonas shioyasakiensis]